MDDAPVELMYRRPGSDEHENITDVLNDILIRLERLENSQIDTENIGLTD